MKKHLLTAFFLVAIALGGYFFVYTMTKTRPPIPADEMHRALAGRFDDCLSCHGPGGSQARSPNHPMGKDCLQCHRWQDSQ